MKKIAVLGSGAIGGMLAAYLKKGGEDVTILSAFRRDSAEKIQTDGLSVSGPYGSFQVFPKAMFLDDLAENIQYDYVFLGLKANDYVSAVTRLRPHLQEDGCVITLQNGINEEFLTPILGEKRVVAGVSFAGGKQVDATHFEDHDGSYTIGELDGSNTPRLQEIAAILRHARPTEITNQIRREQWIKLGTVALHVPCCTITGDYMQEAFGNCLVQRMFPILAREVFAVAAADGYPDITVQGRSRSEWEADPYFVPGPPPGDEMPKEDKRLPEQVVDAYTRDIQRHADLEIDFTSGTIVRLGKKYGVPTPANETVIAAVRAIEAGKETPGSALMQSLLQKLET